MRGLPSDSMEQVIDKVRYRVADSTLLAHDRYWDGHNWERHGRNTFLYRSPSGRFFAVHLTLWQGEHDRIEALDTDTAYELYEQLRAKELEVEDAFPGITITPA